MQAKQPATKKVGTLRLPKSIEIDRIVPYEHDNGDSYARMAACFLDMKQELTSRRTKESIDRSIDQQ